LEYNFPSLANGFDKKLKNEEIAVFIAKTPIFEGVELKNLKRAAENSQVHHFRKGSIIFQKGEPSNWMYIIRKGSIAEFVRYGSSVDIIVKTRKACDYIGEMGMLIDEPYTCTAVAMENSTLYSFSKEKFLELAWSTPKILQHIISQLIDRLNNSCEKFVNAMHLDAEGRLAFTIIQLANDKDTEGDNIKINVTQDELAASSGMARQTVASILGQWRKQGWILTSRGSISVKNRDALMDVIVDSELK